VVLALLCTFFGSESGIYGGVVEEEQWLEARQLSAERFRAGRVSRIDEGEVVPLRSSGGRPSEAPEAGGGGAETPIE
jgi:hypothetical protein